jgi:hypothetical protein
LPELVGQDFDVDDDGVPRLYRGTPFDRIISTVDREVGHPSAYGPAYAHDLPSPVARPRGFEPLTLAPPGR